MSGFLESEKTFYQEVISNTIVKLEEFNKALKNKETTIKSLREKLYDRFQKLNIHKFSLEDFNKIENAIKEFQIELQISALNGKVKSLDMPEFSNIIEVIGERLNEESFKVLLRFNEIKQIFVDVMSNFEHIETELKFLKYTNIATSKILDKFINKLKERQDLELVIDSLEEMVTYIFFLFRNDLSINYKEFVSNVNQLYRKLNFLINDFDNFTLKIQYLNIITSIETGRLKENKFIMVVHTLDNIHQEARSNIENLKNMFDFYNKNLEKFDKYYNKLSQKLKSLFFGEYFNMLSQLKDELDGAIKFFNKLKEVGYELNQNS